MKQSTSVAVGRRAEDWDFGRTGASLAGWRIDCRGRRRLPRNDGWGAMVLNRTKTCFLTRLCEARPSNLLRSSIDFWPGTSFRVIEIVACGVEKISAVAGGSLAMTMFLNLRRSHF